MNLWYFCCTFELKKGENQRNTDGLFCKRPDDSSNLLCRDKQKNDDTDELFVMVGLTI